MKINGRLNFGLKYKGKILYDYQIKPLTIGGNLKAIELLEDAGLNAENNNVKQQIVDSLAYWTQQLEVEGLPQDQLTIDYLLENLASDDYATILGSLEELMTKSRAAGQVKSHQEEVN